ncbi:MAG: family 16 glycosylhydrolase [Bacteroidota bacterium]|nr:family 16 glycosylhydrolase [Bacteroidota bacterium]
MKKNLILLLCIPITLFAQTKIYKGAEYRTITAYKYGRFEVRMKSMAREGTLASFFTYNDSSGTPWNEIDIEILGRYTDDVQFNPITPGQVSHVSHYQTSFDPSLDFHTYAFEWTPTYVAWFVEGVEVHRQTGAYIEALTYPQKIMMNVWIPQYPGWVGQWDENVLPGFAYYDWVSYASYTAGAGSVGTGNNFTPHWKDDFNSWDQSRWTKSTHTWNGNACDLLPDNAVFSDGKLVLCLTKETATGFVDYTGPSISYGRAEVDGVRIRFTEEVDPASVEDTSHYIITGMPVLTAALQPDSQTVFLTVANYDTAAIKNVVMVNIKDRFAKNVSLVKNVTLIKSKPLSFPMKINCGGDMVGNYFGDQEWNASVEYGRMDGAKKAYSSSLPIAGTSEPEIYRAELSGVAEYNVRVPNGSYDVTLMMAENNFTSAGKRIFDVSIEGKSVLQKFDLFAAAGANTAYEKKVTNVLVSDGILEIHFSAWIDQPIINGIIVSKSPSGIAQQNTVLPKDFELFQNFPNPFNPATVISYQLPIANKVTLKVYDVLGKEVASLVNGVKEAGYYSVTFNAAKLPSGIYFARLQQGDKMQTKKMMLLK